jgi:hypothetical protein
MMGRTGCSVLPPGPEIGGEEVGPSAGALEVRSLWNPSSGTLFLIIAVTTTATPHNTTPSINTSHRSLSTALGRKD